VLVYESGPIGARPPILPLSIGDGNLAETADTVVSTPEIFRYWLQGGRIDVGLLGAAQIDRFANINTTVVGPYHRPKVRLPGAGGAPEISSSAKEVLIVVKQSKRAFVDKVDFITSVGFLNGGDSRERAGLTGKGPVAVITDLCILRPDAVLRELQVASIHPGVSREAISTATGWRVQFASDCSETEPPRSGELEVLRDLKARTAAAHGAQVDAA
jgi:glutaconate CoA-transferase subunit B